MLIQIAPSLVCLLSTVNTGKEFQTKCSLTSSSPSVPLVQRWLALSSSLQTNVFLIVSQMLSFLRLLRPLVLQWATLTSMCVFTGHASMLSEGATLLYECDSLPCFVWNMLRDDLLNFSTPVMWGSWGFIPNFWGKILSLILFFFSSHPLPDPLITSASSHPSLSSSLPLSALLPLAATFLSLSVHLPAPLLKCPS